jgi:hypothetical protein
LKITKHLEEQDLSYVGHFFQAMGYSANFALCSVVLIIHAIFPFLFETYASSKISEMFGDK